MRILLNYLYQYYPFTTASYIEMAMRERKEFEVFRMGENRVSCADVYLNIEPCGTIIRWPGRKTCYWEIDNHIHRGQDHEMYEKVDYIFITQKHFLHLYPKKKTFWVPLGADPEKHKLYPDEKIEFDVGFLGNDTYPRRKGLLEKIGSNYKLLRSTAKPGEEYSRMLSRCKLLFNCSMDNDMNMRFFEAMSIGRMLLSDKVEGQDDLFKDGEHYVSFTDWPDLNKKIKKYLKNGKKREAIAKNGARYSHAFHTYRDRLNKMLEIMEVL